MKFYDPGLDIQCLLLDKRMIDGHVTIIGELAKLGFIPSIYLMGSGHGSYFKGDFYYQHQDVDPPGVDKDAEDFKKCRQSYNYGLCVLDLLKKHVDGQSPFLWMLEDDAMLNQPKFSMYWDAAWKEVIYGGLIDWFDILYIGGNHICGNLYDLSVKERDGRDTKLKYVKRPSYSLDLHSVVFSVKGAQKIIEKTANPRYTIDGIIAQMQLDGHTNVLCFDPSLVTQKPGFSYNEFRHVNRSENHRL